MAVLYVPARTAAVMSVVPLAPFRYLTVNPVSEPDPLSPYVSADELSFQILITKVRVRPRAVVMLRVWPAPVVL